MHYAAPNLACHVPDVLDLLSPNWEDENWKRRWRCHGNKVKTSGSPSETIGVLSVPFPEPTYPHSIDPLFIFFFFFIIIFFFFFFFFFFFLFVFSLYRCTPLRCFSLPRSLLPACLNEIDNKKRTNRQEIYDV